jgi:DNA mismatch repair protein MutS
MRLIEEYFQKDSEYKDKFGYKTFLLYQVGSFFEVYALENHESYRNIEAFSSVCGGLAIAQKKICVGKKKVVMAGFRDYLLEKYIEKIHPHDYTIVVYVQEEDNKGKIIRKEFGVYSPGTTFVENNTSLSNNMACIWIQKINLLNKEKIIFGMSNVNIYNGTSNLCEYCEEYYHNPTTYDSIEKFMNVYNPVEVILVHNMENNLVQNIIQFLHLSNIKYYNIDLKNREHSLSIQANNCESQVYQKEIILSFFPKMDFEVFKYNIDDKPICLQSYCFLLNFVSQHNVNLINKIQEPNIEQFKDILYCANHSLKQLNIIGSSGENKDKKSINSVMDILNICHTKMGKRTFNDLLLNPINNHETLSKIYSNTDHIMSKGYIFDEQLSKIKDLDKIMTKLKLRKITPSDIYNIHDSCKLFDGIYKSIKKDKTVCDIYKIDENVIKYGQFMKYLVSKMDMKTCMHMNNLSFDKFDELPEKLIKKGNFEQLDSIIANKRDSYDKLQHILIMLEQEFDKKDNSKYIKQHQPSNSECVLLVTKKRSLNLKKNVDNKTLKGENKKDIIFTSRHSNQKISFVFDLSKVEFKEYNKTTSILFCPEIDKLVMTIHNSNIEFIETLKQCYFSIIEEIYTFYFDFLLSFIESIKCIDIYNSKCNLIMNHNLCKPNIIVKDESFVNAKKMRHILIENIDKNETYIPNDITLESDKNGILLYGTNAVGKTSLIKALGICVIMAQSGLYVPCETFDFCPYKYIFTRIIGNDNIFKGLSTFGVEMSELRVILKNCNQNSLILGDELCSGTEIDSALSIFTSSLEIMSKRKSSFIFATHFHELQQLKEVKSLTNICCKHLKVLFDQERQQLYYDRKLENGQGDSIYGLEVCKSLKMPNEFIERCYEIRNHYIKNKNNILLFKTSKYNKSKLKHMCEFCNSQLASETHHLEYQKDANSNEFIQNSFHKNHCGNLASICENCHHHIHALNLRFEKRKSIDGTYELILKKN